MDHYLPAMPLTYYLLTYVALLQEVIQFKRVLLAISKKYWRVLKRSEELLYFIGISSEYYSSSGPIDCHDPWPIVEEGLRHQNWIFIEPYNCEIFHIAINRTRAPIHPLVIATVTNWTIHMDTHRHTFDRQWKDERTGRSDLRLAPPFSEPGTRYYTGNELNVAQEPLVGALPINLNGHKIGYRNINKSWENGILRSTTLY